MREHPESEGERRTGPPPPPRGRSCARSRTNQALVAHAKKTGAILVFDAAYAPFIRTPGVPKSIYEIEGAIDCAIECNSFSKCGARRGGAAWSVSVSEM